jgi:preprotein translocase subunit SecG
VLNVFLLVIDFLSGLFLVLTILLHQGRGGGLSDMFGGPGGGSSLQGSTVVEKNLDRITILMALIFFFSTIALGLRLN